MAQETRVPPSIDNSTEIGNRRFSSTLSLSIAMKKHILILLFLSLFCLQLATFAAAAEAEVDAFDVEDDDDEDVASFEENDAEDMALDGDDDDDDDLGDDEMGTFMEENAADPDVVQLPSGIQYKVLKSGSKSGAKSPRDDSYCRVHYEGKLTNGVVFDSTYAREQPVVFRTNQVRRATAA